MRLASAPTPSAPLVARFALCASLLAFAGCVDVPERAVLDDASPPDAMRVPDVPLMPPVCEPADEVCNGDDDDCDGRIDEADPELCVPCRVPGQVGACAEGRRVCADGALECRIRGAPPARGCDLVDGDCDGRWDEAGEMAAEGDPLVGAQCGADALRWGRADDPGVCDDGLEVGCGPVHACLDRACIDACDAQAGAAFAACAGGCGGDGPCRTGCADELQPALRRCVAACPAPAEDVARWRCVGDAGGPRCTIAACAAGARLVDGRCERFEICNDGIDDDGDGLVDGTVGAPGVCEAVYAPPAVPSPVGACPPGQPGCDGLRGEPLWSCYDGPDEDPTPCPFAPTLTYDYALDAEEVSNRAYHACVAAGACTEPTGLAWRQTAVLFDFDAVPEREAAPRCLPPVALDPRVGADIDPMVVDLPVTSVTWCQARDYCLWAGKRLPTEVEWERAATGTAPRRPWPWGDAPPAACYADQCCGGEGERPAGCPAGPLPPCPGEADGPRSACQATLGAGDSTCGDGACPDCLPGPAPVFANPDGANEEGVLNLIGNAGEWTFDWASPSYSDLLPFDPVGAPCSAIPGPAYRVTRGGDYLRPGPAADALARVPFLPGGRFPGMGFRCARTVQTDDDGAPELCDPGRLGRATSPRDDPRPPCLAPDFDDAIGFPGCPPGVRVPSATCTEGHGRVCAVELPEDEAAPGCGAYITTRLAVDVAPLYALFDVIERVSPLPIALPRPDLPPVVGDLISRLFDGDLLANGGRTIIALDTPCGFGGDGIYPARLMNAIPGLGGALTEMGEIDPPECARLDSAPFRLVTQAGNAAVDNVCVQGRGELYITGAAARIPHSGLMFFGGELSNDRSRLSGTMLFVISQREALDSTLGDAEEAGVRALLDGLSVQPIDLCMLQGFARLLPTLRPEQAALLGAWDCAAFAAWPGCSEQNSCVGVGGDTSMCTGWMVPFRAEATARWASDQGLGACACE